MLEMRRGYLHYEDHQVIAFGEDHQVRRRSKPTDNVRNRVCMSSESAHLRRHFRHNGPMGSPLSYAEAKLLAQLALKYRLPGMFQPRVNAEAGGLMSYGPELTWAYQQIGSYAGRILQGAKPSELPVQLPTKFQLLINHRTAKALGLEISRILLAQADDVIE